MIAVLTATVRCVYSSAIRFGVPERYVFAFCQKQVDLRLTPHTDVGDHSCNGSQIAGWPQTCGHQTRGRQACGRNGTYDAASGRKVKDGSHVCVGKDRR